MGPKVATEVTCVAPHSVGLDCNTYIETKQKKENSKHLNFITYLHKISKRHMSKLNNRTHHSHIGGHSQLPFIYIYKKYKCDIHKLFMYIYHTYIQLHTKLTIAFIPTKLPELTDVTEDDAGLSLCAFCPNVKQPKKNKSVNLVSLPSSRCVV